MGSFGNDGRGLGGRTQADSKKTVMNVSILKELIGDDESTVRGFLESYLRTARDLGEQFGAACRAGDAAQARAVAHKLKSSSYAIGALALGDLCTEIEIAGSSGDAVAVRSMLSSLEAELQRVARQIDAYLGKGVL